MGLGRTGTNSLKVALEQLLGGTCYHMIDVGNHGDDHAEQWAKAFDGEHPDWHAFFADYTATVDMPASLLWRSIADAFPDALILLSVRAADAWWKSASSTIFPAMAQAYFAPDSADTAWSRMAVAMMRALTPDWRDESAAKTAYLRHNQEVRDTAPADRLLEWSPGDGWAPICGRLGLPVPDAPFPHTNTTDEWRARVADNSDT